MIENEHKTSVVISSNQALMQQIVNLVGHGYRYVHAFSYPEEATARWPEIDAKLLNKFPLLGAGKDKRYRRKKQGKINARLLRLDSRAFLMVTVGEDDSDFLKSHHFVYVWPRRLTLRIDKLIEVGLTSRHGVWTWSFSKSCHATLKNQFIDAGRRGNRREVQALIDKIVAQVEPKGRIRKELQGMVRAAVKEAKKRRYRWKLSHFFIKFGKKAVDVFV